MTKRSCILCLWSSRKHNLCSTQLLHDKRKQIEKSMKRWRSWQSTFNGAVEKTQHHHPVKRTEGNSISFIYSSLVIQVAPGGVGPSAAGKRKLPETISLRLLISETSQGLEGVWGVAPDRLHQRGHCCRAATTLGWEAGLSVPQRRVTARSLCQSHLMRVSVNM